jgi:hypothetical protein
MRHLFDNTKAAPSLVPAVYTSDQAYGAVTAVDTQGYNDAMLVVAVGDLDAASGDETYAVKLFECDTSGGTYTDTGIAITIDKASDNTISLARITELNVTRKRFLKATLDVGGTSPSFPGTALILLGSAFAGAVNSD